MSNDTAVDETNNNDSTSNTNGEENKSTSNNSNTSDDNMIAKLVAEQVAEQLKDIKGKLNDAYKVRDTALKKAEELEKKEREEQLRLLEEQGKHKELYELKMVEKDAAYNELVAKVTKLEQINLELTRDVQIRDLLRVAEFKNEKAAEMAFHEISNQMIKDDKGNWIHRSGINMADFVKAFLSEEANSFLLKPKVSSGSGTTTPGTSKGNSNKSLFALSQTEVLQLAAKGELSRR